MTPPDSGEREVPAFKRAFNETMERTGHHVSIPLPLAQRILAAMEDPWGDFADNRDRLKRVAIAQELRAIVERKT